MHDAYLELADEEWQLRARTTQHADRMRVDNARAEARRQAETAVAGPKPPEELPPHVLWIRSNRKAKNAVMALTTSEDRFKAAEEATETAK